MSNDGLEGVLDALGRECRPLISIEEKKWKFGGLDLKGLGPFEVDVASLGSQSKSLQEISDYILALDSIQFSECQRRRKWHERLAKETDPAIRLEITKRLLDSDDKALGHTLEMVRLLKGTKSVSESTNESTRSTSTDGELENVYVDLPT